MSTTEPKTSAFRLAIAWVIVAVPLGWGVYQSVVKSLPLFRAPDRLVMPNPPR
jgi:hypothetical protein